MRIGIVNDLALAREVLRRVVASVPGYAVAWTAGDGEEAVRRAAADPPDAVLMDLVMPNVDGAEATRRILKEFACPVLVVTATVSGNYDRVIRAMGAGALDAVETPALGPDGTVRNEGPLLARLAKLAAARRATTSGSEVMPRLGARGPAAAPAGRPPLVLIGASTGGPDALAAVLAAFPADFPAAVLVAQHIAAAFAPALVSLLAGRCKLPVRAAADGDRPAAGQVLVAATDDHLEVTPGLAVRYTKAPAAYPYRPSVDVLFGSAAVWPRPGVGVLLTGMGPDGAAGLLRLRTLGWHTVAQDEGSCVVYGMPKVAAERGAAAEVLPLGRIGPAVALTIQTGHRP
jgi:two-component system response regulator WspF